MAPAAERHRPNPRRSAGGPWTTARSLYLTLSRSVSGQHRPSTATEFSRIGPKPTLRPRGELISAWIRSQEPREPFSGCLSLVGN